MFTRTTPHSLVVRSLNLALALVLVAMSAVALPAGPAAAADCQTRHTVQRGETLYRIGLKYNYTWDRIAAANGITNPNKIYAGQKLCIPKPASPQPAPGTGTQPTNVQYVRTLTDVNVRSGPGMEHTVLGKYVTGATVQVTGVSANGLWWRVACLDHTLGNCWITARAQYTVIVPPAQPPSAVPTIRIMAVVRDQSVTIMGANFPAGTRFDVRMGEYGTQGVGGLYVTTLDTGTGGPFTQSLDIPAALRGGTQIAIRLESAYGYYSYNWFWNNTTS